MNKFAVLIISFLSLTILVGCELDNEAMKDTISLCLSDIECTEIVADSLDEFEKDPLIESISTQLELLDVIIDFNLYSFNVSRTSSDNGVLITFLNEDTIISNNTIKDNIVFFETIVEETKPFVETDDLEILLRLQVEEGTIEFLYENDRFVLITEGNLGVNLDSQQLSDDLSFIDFLLSSSLNYGFDINLMDTNETGVGIFLRLYHESSNNQVIYLTGSGVDMNFIKTMFENKYENYIFEINS